MHRFLIHHVLGQTGFTPRGVIFPVSATMLKNLDRYDETLELFSKPLLHFVEYTLDEEKKELPHRETMQTTTVTLT